MNRLPGQGWINFINAQTSLGSLPSSTRKRRNRSNQLSLNLTGETAEQIYKDITALTSAYLRNQNTDVVNLCSDGTEISAMASAYLRNQHTDVVNLCSDSEESVEEESYVHEVVDDESGDDNDIEILTVENSGIKNDLAIVDEVTNLVSSDEDDVCIEAVIPIKQQKKITKKKPQKKVKQCLEWCSICQDHFTKNSFHENSIIHQYNVNTNNNEELDKPTYYIPQTNIGYRMLVAQGWKDTEGLGRDGRGQKYPVKTVFKTDRAGLGMDKTIARVTHLNVNNPKAVKKTRKKLEKIENILLNIPMTFVSAGIFNQKKKVQLSNERLQEIQLRKELS